MSAAPREPESPRHESPRPATDTRLRPNLYRVVWRWHFYAGLIVAPFLMLTAATGGLSIFRDEIEGLQKRPLRQVVPAGEPLPLARQIAAARGAHSDLPATGISVDTDASRSTEIHLRDRERKRTLHVYVNPYTAAVLGNEAPPSRSDTGFFPTVLALHRRMFLGYPGRILVELTTSWGIVLLLTGFYLWWPRRAADTRRGFLPRWRSGGAVLLKDVHTLVGVFVLPVAATIFLSALWYTPLWGQAFRKLARQAGMVAFVVPPRSAIPKSTGGDPLQGIDAAVANLTRLYPDGNFFIGLPQKPDDGYFVTVQGSRGPSTWGVLVLDRRDGSVLTHRRTNELAFMDFWTRWNIAFHTGSAFGLPSKILWGAATLALLLLPATGLWMWWRRRPAGSSGFSAAIPLAASTSTRPPAILIGLGLLVSVLLPAVGLSLGVILAGERIATLAARRRSRSTLPAT